MVVFFSTPQVYAYAYEAGSLYVQADKPLGPKATKVKVNLANKEGVRTQVLVQEALEPCLLSWHRIETSFGKPRPHTYRVSVVDADNVDKFLAVLVDPLPKLEDKRAEARVKTSLKVKSNSLPGFTAVVLDISLSGLCLMLQDAVPDQTEMMLQLDLDSEQHQRVNLRARICWVRPFERNFKAGITFIDRLNYQDYTALTTYIQWARKIEAGEFGVNTIRG
jgi:hypothetical protein